MRLFWMQYSRRILILGLICMLIGVGARVLYLDDAHDSPVHPVADVFVDNAPSIAPIWDSVTISQRESEIAAALQCARVNTSQPLEINLTLDNEAHDLLTILSTLTDTDHLFSPYDWALVSPIKFDGSSPSGCGWSDFDPATMDIEHIQHVGIALAPPVGYTSASVLILGKGAK